MKLTPLTSIFLAPLLVVAPLWAEAPQVNSPSEQPDAAASLQIKQGNAAAAQGLAFAVQVESANGTPVPDAAVLFRLPDNSDGTFADGARSAVVYTDATGRAQVSGLHWTNPSNPVTLRITATKGDSHAGMLIEQPAASTAASAVQAAVATAATRGPAIPGTPATKAAAPQQNTSANSPNPKISVSKVQPSVSVSSTPAGEAPHASHKKWLILALVAAGAGAGVAMAGKGKGSGSTSSTPSLSIGTPNISLGH